jgi:DNA-binding NarL/FixJ family response regulator
VLERIAAGQALGQIADELHLSPKTVSTHKMRLMQKLNLQTNADLLKYAVRHGITSG